MAVTRSSTGAPGHELLDGLTASQARAVTTPAHTVCVMAAAGAGKTRVLTRRVAYRVAQQTAGSRHVLAITFTRKAAEELRQRLGQAELGEGDLGREVTAGTFHSLALSQLRRWWADRRTPEPAVIQSKARLVGELAAGRPGLEGVPLAELSGALEWAAARLVAAEDLEQAATLAGRQLPAPAEALTSLMTRYTDEKRRRRVVDFDDLLRLYVQALREDARFGAAQRWRWRHLFVDEVQDVNPLQCQVLTTLLGDNDDLFVVGDPNQAIYGWNGADPGFLTSVPDRWPGTEVVHLDDNHRSSPQVVALAAAVLGRPGAAVRSSQPDGPLPELRSFPDEEREAATIAGEVVRAHLQGLDWGAMAVLARTNVQLTGIAEALARAGAPTRLLGPDRDAAGTGQADGPGEGPARVTSYDRPGAAEDAVALGSFHRAKGLQWPAVWLAGLESGLVPIAYAEDQVSLAEERRLLYVALTRAERELHCSWARERRTASGARLRRGPSPWLAAVAAHFAGSAGALADGPDATAPGLVDFFASARRRLAGSRAARGEAPADGQTEALARRLDEWRRRLARASGVPAHVLLHDATVQLLAERRPRTLEELAVVPGLGPVKVARFGPALLEVVEGALADLGMAAGA